MRNAEYALSRSEPAKTSRLPATCPMRKPIMMMPVTAITTFLPIVERQKFRRNIALSLAPRGADVRERE